MQEFDYKKRADVIIEGLEKFLDFYIVSLKDCENSERANTEEGRKTIENFKALIKDVQEEIEAYEQYKATGVLITRKAREQLRKAKERKNDDERDL